MKTALLKVCSGAAIVAMALVSSSRAEADTIAIGSPAESTINTIGNGETLGTAGYELFGVGGASSPTSTTGNLPTWVASFSTSGDGFYGSSPESSITAIDNSGTYSGLTGIAYAGADGATLATITLAPSGNIPSEFQLGLLGDNGSNDNRDADFNVSDNNGGTPVATSEFGNQALVNDFYLVDITGAVNGEIITIVGDASTQGNGGPAIGGITFDSLAAAPEPATLSLLAVGSLGLLARRRRSVT
jgi:PEP-CTERM motif